MFTRHFSEQLEAHLDGELAPQSARQVESHLRECRRCAAEREEIEWGIGLLEQLPRLEAPELIWSSIEASLAADRPRAAPRPLWLRWALAAALLLCLAGAAYWRTTRPADPAWVVLRVAGSPSVDAKQLNGRGWVRPGEWIETDTKSRATIEVGGIGSVEVSPNTRLRVVEARAGEHRLRLAHGQIQAAISAPPKLFLWIRRPGPPSTWVANTRWTRVRMVPGCCASPKAGYRFNGRNSNRLCRRGQVAGPGRSQGRAFPILTMRRRACDRRLMLSAAEKAGSVLSMSSSRKPA